MNISFIQGSLTALCKYRCVFRTKTETRMHIMSPTSENLPTDMCAFAQTDQNLDWRILDSNG